MMPPITELESPMPAYREYDVTITRTVTARVRVEETQTEAIKLARDVALVLWRDPGTEHFTTSATETTRTFDSGTTATVIDMTDRNDRPAPRRP
jgi:hypothetical protein